MERNLLKAEMHWQALVQRLLKAIQSFSKMSAKRCRNASGMLENFTFHGLVLKVLYPVRQAQRWEGEKQRLSTVSRVVVKWATFPWSLAVDQREKTGFTQWHSVTVAGRGYVGPFGAFWAPMRDHKWLIYIYNGLKPDCQNPWQGTYPFHPSSLKARKEHWQILA